MMVIIMKSPMDPCIAVFNIHVLKISLSIPDICHGHADGVRGEKICHIEKFLYMTDEEKSKVSPHVN